MMNIPNLQNQVSCSYPKVKFFAKEQIESLETNFRTRPRFLKELVAILLIRIDN